MTILAQWSPVAGSEAAVRGVLRYNEPIAPYTTWAVGGTAKRFFEPADVMDLRAFLVSMSSDEPQLWIGLGSNLLVDDSGFDGTVIRIGTGLASIAIEGEHQLRCDAGARCAKVARVAAQAGLSGVEFLAGIPGTMGGALAMNAGAGGGELWQYVVRVQTINRGGQVMHRSAGEFRIGYRSVQGFETEAFIGCELQLLPGDPQSGMTKIRKLLTERNRTQPNGMRSCGSVFRNPPGDFAGRLIEACELKGESCGAAMIADKHANFIINTGGATATDIRTLIQRMQARVYAVHDIWLQPEVHIVGQIQSEPASDQRSGTAVKLQSKSRSRSQ